MHGKRILSLDQARLGDTVWLPCCFDDCEKHGVNLHQAMLHDHNPGIRCSDPTAKHPVFVFCSERHRQYFLASHRIGQGRLPTGSKGTLL